MDSVCRSDFLLQSCPLFRLLTRFIDKMTLLVAMFAVPGCAEILESVFLNFNPFGVRDSFGERIGVFSVGNVELIFHV